MDKLVSLFGNFQEQSFFHNGVLALPLHQLDVLVWLMKCCLKPAYKIEDKNIRILIAQNFLHLYLSRIEQVEVQTLNYSTGKFELRRPIWSEKNVRLELIDWATPSYFFHVNNVLSKFLSPKFRFIPAETVYDRDNSFNCQKLRTHFNILLLILKKLSPQLIVSVISKEDAKQIRNAVEKKIAYYVKNFSEDIPEKGKIDIFDSQNERGLFAPESEQILPKLGQAINWFDSKEEILQTIAGSSDIIRILFIAEWISSVGAKNALINQIKKEKVNAFLENRYWKTDIIYALNKMIEYPVLLEYIDEILLYWEKMPELLRNQNNLVHTVFQTRLFLAYEHKNEAELDNIDLTNIPPIFDEGYIEPSDYKEFFRALIQLSHDPEAAFGIFNKLLIKYPKKPSFALNRFAAGISRGIMDKDNQMQLEALNSWLLFEEQFKGTASLKFVEENVTLNKLIVLHNIAEYENFDKLFFALEVPYKMLPKYLEVRMENLIDRKMDVQARELLKEARIFHQFESEPEPEFLKRLTQLIEGVEGYLKILKGNYLDIFSSKPETLIKIFPQNLNGFEELNQFLTKEIVAAADKMLDKIKSIEKINDEDSYTALIVLAMEARFILWGWQIYLQSPGGYSGTCKRSGERDFVIKSQLAHLVVVEALIFKSKTTIQAHFDKIFNYSHDRKFFIMAIYYTGTHSSFEKKWVDYSKTIVPSLKYPRGFSLKGNKIKDITKKLSNSSAIKVGSSKHGNTIIHHIFININYRMK